MNATFPCKAPSHLLRSKLMSIVIQFTARIKNKLLIGTKQHNLLTYTRIPICLTYPHKFYFNEPTTKQYHKNSQHAHRSHSEKLTRKIVNIVRIPLPVRLELENLKMRNENVLRRITISHCTYQVTPTGHEEYLELQMVIYKAASVSIIIIK